MNKHVKIAIITAGILIGGTLVANFFLQAATEAPRDIEASPSIVKKQNVVEDKNIMPEGELPEVDLTPPENLAPNFTLSQIGGGEVTLSDFRGKKPVILDFFASWCHNCRRDMPNQQKLYEKYGSDVEVIAVNVQEKTTQVERYAAKNHFTFPIVLDKDGHTSNKYGIRFTNTHVLVGKDGTIKDVVLGDVLDKHFQSLLK